MRQPKEKRLTQVKNWMFQLLLAVLLFVATWLDLGVFVQKGSDTVSSLASPAVYEDSAVESSAHEEIESHVNDDIDDQIRAFLLPPELGAELIEAQWRLFGSSRSGSLVSNWQRAGSSDFKILRVEQELRRDRISANWRIEQTVLMSGDGFIVSCDAESFERFAKLNAVLFQIERRHTFSPVFRIRIEDSSIGAFEHALGELSELSRKHQFRVSRDYGAVLTSTPNDPEFADGQNDLALINIDTAWGVTTGADSIIVGVIDSGQQLDHPDLAANLFVNPFEIAGNLVDDDGNGLVDDVNGWDFYGNDNDPTDVYGHGTSMSGIIAAVGHNSTGVAGTSWNSKIMPLRAGNGIIFWSTAIQAIDYAISMKSNGVCVAALNHSYAGAISDPEDLTLLTAAFLRAETADIPSVASAGNDGEDLDGLFGSGRIYPASLDSDALIVVAATRSNDQLASFSNYGTTSVDLAAPGTNTFTTQLGGSYGVVNGTSGSCARISGVIALLASRNPSFSAAQLKSLLVDTASVAPDLIGFLANPVRVDAGRALSEASLYPEVAWEDGKSDSVFVQADNTQNWGAQVSPGAAAIGEVRLLVNGIVRATDRDGNDGWGFDWIPLVSDETAQLSIIDTAGREITLKSRELNALDLFDYWRYENWGEGYASDAESISAADPDFDRICNLWEYAIGTDPLDGHLAEGTLYNQVEYFDGPQGEAFGLTFRFRISDPRLRFSLEEGDLQQPWKVVDFPAIMMLPDPLKVGFSQVQLGVALTELEGFESRFLRVALSRVLE